MYCLQWQCSLANVMVAIASVEQLSVFGIKTKRKERQCLLKKVFLALHVVYEIYSPGMKELAYNI